VNDLTHIDLFSGIGGFALAAQRAGFRTVAFCEIELFCQEVLKARFGAIANTKSERLERRGHGETRIKKKAVRLFSTRSIKRPILYSDIRDFDGARFRGATLLTGGVPCQPASIAGKRKGTADDRWLWPEAIRVLVEVKPTWAIFENPCGILSLEQGVVFEDLLAQMEGKGYEVRPVIIPACAVNAPHRRDRVWILAHNATGGRCLNGSSNKQRRQVQNIEVGKIKENEPEWSGWIGRAFKGDNDDPLAQNALDGGDGRRGDGDTRRLRRALQTAGSNSDAPDASSQRLSGDVQRKLKGVSSKIRSPERGQPSRGTTENEQWEEPWFEVATRLCRVDAKVSNQVDRLKALGNSIVPQVAYEIIKEIAGIEGRKP